MGRKVNPTKVQQVLKVIEENSDKVRAVDVAKEAGMHPQEVTRILPVFEEEGHVKICEDDDGFLSVFKDWWK